VRPPVLAASILGSAVMALAAACGNNAEVPSTTTTTAASGLGGAPPGEGGRGGAGGNGAGGEGGIGGSSEGGGAPATLVGLLANAVRDDATPATRAAEVEAASTVYAAGAVVAAGKRQWAHADAATLAADAELAQAGCTTEGPCRPVALTLALVDGALDGRPDALASGSWSSPASKEALDVAIDAVFDAFGDDLVALSLGARVDRWISIHEDDEADMLELLEHAVDHARDRGREELLIGVGVSGDGAVAVSGPAVALRALGTTTMVSLFPGLHAVSSGDALPSPAAAAQALDTVDDVDPGRAVVLIEVGYPSADLLGASEDAQAVFFTSLFNALQTRRASFPYVVASRLHDLAEEACAAEGAELGEEDELVLAYRCSTGLRDADGASKPAWSSVLLGLAQLASSGTTSGP
jgi:hypothetical protein